MTEKPNTPTLDLVLSNRYRLVRLIGSGGMASVYRAHDEALRRDVAIKIFRAAATGPTELRRQASEISLLATLTHPGLVALFDAGTDESDPLNPRSYLVMELIRGSDLRNAIDEKELRSEDIRAIGADLADSLHFIHSNGVVHRDIKPANILLAHTNGTDTRPHPKLSDFGIARLVDDSRLTATSFTVGSAGYLSPEQARGDDVGPPTDVYSLGLVLLECVTGQRAFSGSGKEVAFAPITRDPQIPEGLDPILAETIAAMTVRNPSDRPTAHEVALALRGIAPIHGFRRSADAETDATAAMTAPTSAPTEAEAQHSNTEASPAAPAPDITAVLEQGPPPIPDALGATPRRRRTALIVSIVVTLLLIAAAAFGIPALNNANDQTTPIEYPAVPGTIGEHLEDLQESVEP
ncbi:serine/threonine protein kinase [Mycetocola manganoxydans]|uniref:non-specific serine/threonine protein kinase n=1 Tax=Mycetocola manganoxydans TaxID=699879 RepID=A0A3L6ZMP9_9MICO|nr:serine/threonine-protein kinase [Mycetocola manganoxydans]RLP68821.1 serine/threonine protein kinase [Mycetocola manganoxydans]GHD51029.1 hypothetical protein GCM10008097_25490 [Mycetocola manganoxydans]